jgi:uncharacterized membrane protein YfhO
MAQKNTEALGNAWFVNSYSLVDNADQELNALTNFNPANTAIIDKVFGGELKSYSPGRDTTDMIRLTEYKPNDLTYKYTTKNTGLAVFSEIYYPKGWNAYVDGKILPHFRANYVLRAMVLPAGEHTVEFRFEPRVYMVGEKVSRLSSIVLLLLVVAAIAWGVKDLYGRKA